MKRQRVIAHWRTRVVFALEVLAWAAIGWSLGLVAWGPSRTPAVAVALPLLWLMARGRMQAFAITAAYHMAVVRFLPDFASTWFHSAAIGVGYWIALGLVSGGVWAAFWPRKNEPSRIALSTVTALTVLLVTPLTAVVPGQPIVAWGFLAPRTGWFGVALMFVVTPVAGCLLRVWLPRSQPAARFAPGMLVVLLLAALWWRGDPPSPDAGRLAGKVGAITTQLGGFPEYGSLEVGERLARIGEATRSLAGGEDGIDTIVFPEAILGLYDPSLYSVTKLEIGDPIRETGQTVIVGADVGVGGHDFQNAALIFRPDGTSTSIAARQATPFAQWQPWNDKVHFPADWFAPSTANIGGGIRARFMFCHEEWMPILHLLSEAREDHQLVIVLANLWAAHDPLASFIQGEQTEGMARLFGRRWVRSVNLAKPQK